MDSHETRPSRLTLLLTPVLTETPHTLQDIIHRTMKYSSCLLLLAVISSASAYIHPKGVKTDVNYVLSVADDDNKVLDSKHGWLTSETRNVGDEGQQFQFRGRIPAEPFNGKDWDLRSKVFCRGGGRNGGYLYDDDDSVATTGNDNEDILVTAHTFHGGIRLRVKDKSWVGAGGGSSWRGALFKINELPSKRRSLGPDRV